ncbi:MAG: hypothetical protein ACI4J2_10575 [Ruminococcus sp.]
MSIDSDIYAIQSKISHEQARNAQLRSELSQLAAGVQNAVSQWNKLTSHITGTLQNGTNRVNDSHEITLRAYELEGEVEKIYALYKNVELANKKIRECKNRIYYEFSNYRAVRKVVEALLNNVEMNFVSDKTLTKAIEREHLQIPDYWLTCALIAIMAWKDDNKNMAQRALDRACKLDLIHTSIFFFAFHLRIGKNLTALKWFNTYIQCGHTGEEQGCILLIFSMLCNTIKADVSDGLIDSAEKFINSLVQEMLQKEGYSEDDIVKKIMNCLASYSASESMDYPILSKYCTEKGYLLSELNAARTNRNYLDMIKKTLYLTNEEKNNYLNKFIDNLIASSNEAEKEVNREIIYNEYIISYKGDVEAAKASFDEYVRHSEDELDIINEMVDWIYHPSEDVGDAERQRMYIMTKNYHETAITNKVNEYRSTYKRNLGIKINEYETTADFDNQPNEVSKIETFFHEKQQRLLSEVKLWPCFVWFAIALLAIVGTIYFGNPAILILTAVGAAGGVLHILTSDRKKKKIVSDCAVESNNTKDTFAQICQDFDRYETEYKEFDAIFDDIQTEFAKL